MPINEKYIEDFVENEFMHIICKSISGSILFKDEENKSYFLQKYAQYSTGYLNTYSYILLDNHSHLLVKCTNSNGLKSYLRSLNEDSLKTHQKKYLTDEINYSQAIEFQMKDFFIAYAMAFNKKNDRSGSLFVNPFRRVRVSDELHLHQLIIYIHANVLKHNIHSEFQNYKWSSYLSIISDKKTALKREEVLDLFGGIANFIQQHQIQSQYFYGCNYQIE
jgi:putative transposase